jgi:hypothetical protein
VNTILQPARAVVFVKKVGGDYAVRPGMPKILTKLTQGCLDAHGLSIADRRCRTFGKMVHRSKAMRKMNVRTVPEL